MSEEVEAADGFAAIHQLAGELDGWTIDRTRPIVAVRNPDAANTSGRYCDYWMAVPLEFQWGELSALGDGHTMHQYITALGQLTIDASETFGIMGVPDSWGVVYGEDGLQYDDRQFETAEQARAAAEALMLQRMADTADTHRRTGK